MPEQQLTVAKAQPHRRPVPGALILITDELPATFEDLAEAAAFYDDQAKEIELSLVDSLPGAVYDRLLGHMSARKASLFRVAHGAEATA